MQVLVVEDDLMLADCLAEALEDRGHAVCGVVSNVADAVALARRHRPDAAIVDMQLHDQERGSDVAAQLAASGDLGHTGILYVTGESDGGQQEVRVGHACLSKPYTLATLDIALEIVREIACNGTTSRALPRGLQLFLSSQRRPHAAL
jgi:CheY-like chemotaxis protein